MTRNESRSLAERLAALPASIRNHILGDADAADPDMAHAWSLWARPAQLPPPGDWSVWLMLAGRGFGKTRSGAEWVRAFVETCPDARVALVGGTLADARAVMVEGESGLLSIGPKAARPRFLASRGELHWPSGARGYLYSAEALGALRGPQHHLAWGDELAKWPDAEEVLANLRMGLRLGAQPRLLLTTTPRPVAVLRTLLADPACVVTRGRTTDNAGNLPPGFIAAVTAAYGGSRLGRQELDGELVDDVEGALWARAQLDACRVRAMPGPPVRIVVAVDPPAGSASGQGDECGIIVAALGEDGRGYILTDASLKASTPDGWARAVVMAAQSHDADRVVAEANNGGLMVEAVLRAVDAHLPIRLVRASHGKVTRAEPVASLYAAGRVAHVGGFPMLEDQMCGLIAGGRYAGPGRSPDRADALVWALSELMLGRTSAPGVRVI